MSAFVRQCLSTSIRRAVKLVRENMNNCWKQKYLILQRREMNVLVLRYESNRLKPQPKAHSCSNTYPRLAVDAKYMASHLVKLFTILFVLGLMLVGNAESCDIEPAS